FDHWSLALKVSNQPAMEGGAAPQSGVQVTQLSVTSRLPRMEMHAHQEEADSGTASGTVSVVLEFKRPVHIKLVTAWMVLSIAAIAACVVFLTPVDALIASATGLVLAVWGIRGILLGTVVPAISAVDAALVVVVVFVLFTTLVRIVWLFESRS